MGGSLAGVVVGVVEIGGRGGAWVGFVGIASDGSTDGFSPLERRRSLNDLLPPDENAAKPPPLGNALKAPPLTMGTGGAGTAAAGGIALLNVPPGIEDAPKVG